MPLPLSKNQVRNLGRRLRDHDPPAPDDVDLLAGVLAAYDAALSVAVLRLSALDLHTSSRLKNTGTIVEKLRRDHSSNLPNIQDLAGARVFLPDTHGRSDQDAAVARIVAEFSGPTGTPRVLDRRVTPSRGYRAVHVVVEVDELPVEIQVRTGAQHAWAEFFERLADRWGRDIRYEGGLPNTGHMLSGLDGSTGLDAEQTQQLRGQLHAVADTDVRHAMAAADLIARVEVLEQRGADSEETAALHAELRDMMAQSLASMEPLLAALRRLG